MNNTFEQLLPVPITEDEKLELCEQLGKDCVRKAELEEEKKKVSSDFNEKIKLIQEDIDLYSHMAATGTRQAKVRCKGVPNYPEKTIEIVRTDTGEIVEARPMTAEELAHIDMNLDAE